MKLWMQKAEEWARKALGQRYNLPSLKMHDKETSSLLQKYIKQKVHNTYIYVAA